MFKVKCVRDYSGVLEEGAVYTVLVVLRDWTDYKGKHVGTGYIVCLKHANNIGYPYVWDSDRFVDYTG